MKARAIKCNQLLIVVWVILFTFQEALSNISSLFSYIDEAPLLILCGISFFKILQRGRVSIRKENRGYYIAIALFVATGLLGNIIYHYQTWNLVFIDVLTNLKFFGAVAYFSLYIKQSTLESKYIADTAKLLTILLTILFIVDRVVNIFPAEYRYGIKSAVLFFGHPTYFAGICAFLIAVMTIYYTDKYRVYILMNLVMMVFTLRSKAIVSAIVYVLLYIIIKKLHGKLKVWQIVIVCIIGVVCAWSQIYFYFINLGGQSARSVMLLTSFLIMKDYFPIGTGFATYASHSAAVNYSPVYSKYGFEFIYELRNSAEGTFFDDQFWPIIFGQTGVIGTICYVYILVFLFKKIQKLYRINTDSYISGLFIFIYLLISSIAEPAFNNSVAIPLAMVMVIAMKRKKLESK